jgi:hypothetical protein
MQVRAVMFTSSLRSTAPAVAPPHRQDPAPMPAESLAADGAPF